MFNKRKIFGRILGGFLSLLLVIQPLTPFLIFAQEAPSSTPESSPSATTTPENSGIYTIQTLQLGTTYKFPLNEKVSLTFTKLPQNSGTVTIKEIKLTSEQIKETGALSDTAYEITSTMEDGTFEYTLTLPTPRTENVEVKYSEDGENFAHLSGGVSAQTDTLTITNLTHLTIFVVTGTIANDNSITPFDESNADVVINEFVFDDTTEWVEFYNRTSSEISLDGWKVCEKTASGNENCYTLSESKILPSGLVVHELTNKLNNNGDTITLKNSQDEIIDQVAYKDEEEGVIVEAQDVGEVDDEESIGRSEDGGSNWERFTDPTKGYNNSGDPTFITVGEDFPYDGIQNAIDNLEEGGTINVLAGSYDEADIIVETENVTIQGPGIGSGVSTRAIIDGSCGDSSPPAMFHLHADGITLKGFEIDASNCEHGVHIGGFSEEFQVAGITVTQNVIYSANYGITISLASSYDSERPNIVSENDISQNDTGVYLLSASNNIIRDNNIHENNTYGIRLDDEGFGPSNNNQILQNTIKEHVNDAGIYSGGNPISNLTITGNEISNNYTGIYLEQITNSLTISDNQITNHSSYGLYLDIISNAQVIIGGNGEDGNTITGNGNDDEGNGIYLGSIENDSSLSLIGNTISDNGSSDNSSGIYVNDLSDSQDSLTIQGNTISGNFGQGIYLNRVDQSTLSVSNNTISGNFYEGLLVSNNDSSTTTISLNTISQNGVEEGYSGIFIRTIRATEGSSTVTVLSNTISQNGNFGIDVSRVESSTLTIGPDNTISGNANAGINLKSRVSGAVITQNTITQNGGGTTGIVVRNALGNQAHLNNISGNGVGIENQDDENAFNAIENWWGSTLGPEGDGADTISGNVLFEPWCFDDDCEHVFFEPPEDSLLEDVSYGLPPGATLSNTQSLTFFTEEIYTIAHAGGSSKVTIPDGVVIQRSDGVAFNANELISQDVTISSLAGLGTGLVADGALQWGLPNIELKFTEPISLNIFVGASFNGQTLNVVRSTSGAGGWTSTGIVAPGTCVVANGLCTFQATLASYFATNRTVSTPTTSTSSSGGGGGGGGDGKSDGAATSPICSDAKPGGAPLLLLAIPGFNSVTLVWSEANAPVSYYLTTYGLSSGAQTYGNPNVGGNGATTYTVSNLSGGTTYYFKVRAGNGCTPGDYSNELSATPFGEQVSGQAAGFAEGVLGTTTDSSDTETGKQGQVQGEKTESIQPSVTIQPQQTIQSPINIKTIVIVVIALLLGFGVFKLLKI